MQENVEATLSDRFIFGHLKMKEKLRIPIYRFVERTLWDMADRETVQEMSNDCIN